MRANEFISEVFQPGKKNWEWVFRGSQEAVADFTVGDRQYRWQAFSESNKTKWEIQFRLIRKDTDPETLDLFGKTGTGNSAEVLSTAVDITRSFIKEYGLDKVEEITFNAKEDSRIGLYAKMINRLLPDWDLYQKKTEHNGMEYHLTDRRAYDKPENKLSEEAKAAKYNGLMMKYAFNDNALILKAFAKEGPLAYVKFVKEGDELYPQDLWVNDDYRNRGIAKSMYDYLKSEGYVINRSHDQTKAGSGFWDKHRGEDAYVWEAFDQPYSIKWEKSEYGDYDAMAKLPDGTPLTVMFDHTEPDEVTITFWRNNNLELTGEGDAQRVFATVLHAIQEFLKIEQPANIKFSASKDVEPGQNAMSRAKLYDKLVKRYAQQWGYDSHSVDHGDGIMYELSKIKEEVDEEIIDEMPLPADWDPQQMRQGATTFKSRLAYALERAKKLGTGSSRVATTIEYQGRPTVLKIAKNQKGLAQNSVEASILEDGYASQMGILIPLIDYDEQNREPSWIHTEMATKVNEKQLCNLLKCPNLSFLVNFATSITGKKRYLGLPQGYIDKLKQSGMSDTDVETCTEYANKLAELNSSFDVELGDFARAANWGVYQGNPVIVDVGFNSNVLKQYYSR